MCIRDRYGGHRLWHAPESSPRSYYPDNSKVDYKIDGSTVILSQQTEKTTGIKKEMEITLFEENSFVEIVHRIKNENIWAIEAAPVSYTHLDVYKRQIRTRPLVRVQIRPPLSRSA